MGSIIVHMDQDTEEPSVGADPAGGKSPAKNQSGESVHDSVDERALRELEQAASGLSGSVPHPAKPLTDTQSENLHARDDPAPDEQVAAKKRKLSTGSASPVHTSPQLHTAANSTSTPQQQDAAMAKKLDPETKRLREEKQRKAQEKEQKTREREEKAKQKEIEKAARDEAKRIKDEERAKEKAKRDEEKAKKDKAKAEEEEKKAKKERAQLRIGSFFVKKDSNPVSAASSRQASVEPTSPAQTPSKGRQDASVQVSDFEKTFPPFFVRPHTTLASDWVRQPTETEVAEAWSRIHAGSKVEEDAEGNQGALLQTFKKPSSTRPIARPYRTTKQLIALINSTPSDPTDLTSSHALAALYELRALTMVFLKFHEDVRPPYIGTSTKLMYTLRKIIGRRPCQRHAFTKLDYDYDSEAEWEEPGEGEDLGSEDEDDEPADSAEADEMADFIDDEGVEGSGPSQPPPAKRQQPAGGDDLVPKCTVLFYEEDHDSTVVPYGDEHLNMEAFRAVCLLPGVTEPIDPWSTKYWDDSAETSNGKTLAGDSTSGTTNGADAATGAVSGAVTCSAVAGMKRKKGFKVPARPLPDELLAEFKDFVFSQSISKLGMIELLKGKFPQVTKATLEQTLAQVAKRDGKKWVAL